MGINTLVLYAQDLLNHVTGSPAWLLVLAALAALGIAGALLSPVNKLAGWFQKQRPWHKLSNRKRAHILVQRVPELAIRPMLLSLLNERQARKQKFREVWDLYAFMVDNWLIKESHWIKPEELLTISKKVAVEIYLGRQERQSERLSSVELSALLQESSSNIQAWKLTGQSLLNRDAMGNYTFAHRSIMEFLFIRSLIEGDQRCTAVQWTDMMCTLFLSWGRSPVSKDASTRARAQALLESNGLSKTGIFPIVDIHKPANKIDAQWAQQALGQSIQRQEHAGIPPVWRKWTSRLLEKGDVVRMYEFAEGIVWQFVLTRGSVDGALYRIPRNDGKGLDKDGRIWDRPTLIEFRSLVETLIAHEAKMLDDRDLYWLADEDAQYMSMARLRDTRTEPEAPEQFRVGVKLIISAQIGHGTHTALDVYAVPKIHRAPAGQYTRIAPAALQVLSLRSDAQRQWEEDSIDSNSSFNWGLNFDAGQEAKSNA